MKKIFFLFILIASWDMASAQKKTNDDIWSGSYKVGSVNNKELTNVDTLIITKIEDADPKELAARYESDLERWTLVSKKGGRKDQQIVRRFLFDEEDKEDAYKEFGWTDLHKNGKMSCIDGGHFFICQTEPNTKVKLSKEEEFLTKTGVFGIWLHYGLVELQKIK